jgi:hypothetical protein
VGNAVAGDIYTTPWINFSDLYGDGSNTLWLTIGDALTGLVGGTWEVLNVKAAA